MHDDPTPAIPGPTATVALLFATMLVAAAAAAVVVMDIVAVTFEFTAAEADGEVEVVPSLPTPTLTPTLPQSCCVKASTSAEPQKRQCMIYIKLFLTFDLLWLPGIVFSPCAQPRRHHPPHTMADAGNTFQNEDDDANKAKTSGCRAIGRMEGGGRKGTNARCRSAGEHCFWITGCRLSMKAVSLQMQAISTS